METPVVYIWSEFSLGLSVPKKGKFNVVCNDIFVCFQLCVNSLCLSFSCFNITMPPSTKPAP